MISKIIINRKKFNNLNVLQQIDRENDNNDMLK